MNGRRRSDVSHRDGQHAACQTSLLTLAVRERQQHFLGTIKTRSVGALAAGADDDDELQALGDDEDLEATPGTELDTDDALLEEDEDDAMAKPVIRKGPPAPATDDDDAIEELEEPRDAELDAVEDVASVMRVEGD